MFTKGEWKIDTGSIATVVVTDRGKIAVVYGNSDKEELANAHLIAAAPDLYEACKGLIAEMNAVNVPSLHILTVIEKAIAKVEDK